MPAITNRQELATAIIAQGAVVRRECTQLSRLIDSMPLDALGWIQAATESRRVLRGEIADTLDHIDLQVESRFENNRRFDISYPAWRRSRPTR